MCWKAGRVEQQGRGSDMGKGEYANRPYSLCVELTCDRATFAHYNLYFSSDVLLNHVGN